MSKIKWWEEQPRLWDELVPKTGQALTLQGELIRCVGNFTDEAYQNGNMNWEIGYEKLVRFVADTLSTDEFFTRLQKLKIITSAEDIIKNYKTPDTSEHRNSYHYLTEMTIRWCIAHPHPIPYEANPTLNIKRG